MGEAMEGLLRRIFSNTDENSYYQFARYMIVGGIAASADFTIYHSGTNLLNYNPLIVNSVSFTVGLIINYYLCSIWVFGMKENNKTMGFAVFSIIGIIGLLISDILIYILLDYRLLYYFMQNMAENIVKIVAKAISVIIVLFWNFYARKKLVFE